jgi:DNA-binding winged helix-turn-helix (wHTH) protein/TolB-like protein/Tfp pilus assembly protein PilF
MHPRQAEEHRVDNNETGPVYRFGDCLLDTTERTLTRNGREILLTPTLFEILRVLVENAGRIVDKDRFMERVWAGRVVEDGNLARNVSTLRKLLEDDPQKPRYIETIARRGYRFVAEVETRTIQREPPQSGRSSPHASVQGDVASAEPPGMAAAPVSSARDLHVPSPTDGARRRFLSFAASGLVRGSFVAACLVLLGTMLAAPHMTPSPAPNTIDSLIVLPFVNLSGDPDAEYLADGLTNVLITSLGQIAALRKVISLNSSMHYKGSNKPLREIAREMGVDAVVEGAVLVSGDRIRVTLQVLEAATERRLAGTEPAYEGRLEDVFALQSRIARAVASTIEIAVTPEENRRLAAAKPVHAETNEAYLRGLHLKNRQTVESLHQAIEHFERALAMEPNFAPALAAMGDAYVILASWQGPSRALWPKARQAAHQALEIDDTLAEAHVVRAGALLCYDLNHEAADVAFLRALQLNPSDDAAHHRYAYSLITQGRVDESIAHQTRALEINPVSLVNSMGLARIYLYARRPEEALRQLDSALELDPHFPATYRYLGLTHLTVGSPDAAIDALEKSMSLGEGPGVLGELAYAYGVSGRTEEALKALRKLEEWTHEGRDTAFSIALVHHGLGDSDATFEWLHKAYDERDFRMILLLVDPIWDSVRADPRFRQLLLLIGLGPEIRG